MRAESPYPKDFQLLVSKLKPVHQTEDDIVNLFKAYEFGSEAHKHQLRKSGEPYFTHCVAVATILAEMNMDVTTITAALLHDVIEDTPYTVEDIAEGFNNDVANLVDGVTKLTEIKFRSEVDKQADNFRKMLLSVAKDIRVIIIKFADRIHNMQTIHHMPSVKQRRIARETRDVYIPLAHRLGMYRLKSELDDLVFSVLEPKAYKELKKAVPKRLKYFEHYINKFLILIKKSLEEVGIEAQFKSRFKSYTSIHKKMVEQGRPLEDVYDIFAIRIVVDTIEECYSVLGFVHKYYSPISHRFRDFIAQPKLNGYQSVHSTVLGLEGRAVEVQIRTKTMDETAEEGVAAHWAYKENSGEVSADKFENRIKWLRTLVDTLQNEENASSTQFMDLLKIDLYKHEIFVFTPQSEVKILPVDATPLDFAFEIHSQVGLHTIGAKVNNKIVPLSTPLHSGDTIEIITSENKLPNSAWLKFVKTSKAKSNIRKWLKKQQFGQSIKMGQEIVERELRKIGRIKVFKAIKDVHIKLGYDSSDKMYAAIGSGHRTISSFINIIFEDENVARQSPLELTKESFISRARRTSKGVSIQGIDNLMLTFGKCCSPIPGDDIVGFITRGRGITVHKKNCGTITQNLTEVERLIDVYWDIKSSQSFLARLRVLGNERKNFLNELTNKISTSEINIDSITMKVENDLIVGIVIVEVEGVKQVDRLMSRLMTIKGVISVERE